MAASLSQCHMAKSNMHTKTVLSTSNIHPSSRSIKHARSLARLVEGNAPIPNPPNWSASTSGTSQLHKTSQTTLTKGCNVCHNTLQPQCSYIPKMNSDYKPQRWFVQLCGPTMSIHQLFIHMLNLSADLMRSANMHTLQKSAEPRNLQCRRRNL